MKILFYTPVKLVSGGGCERWHCDITNSLKNNFGLDVEIVSANIGAQNWTESYLKKQLGKIPYFQLKFPILFGLLIPTVSTFFFLLNKFKKVDAVHFIHGFAGQDILIAILKFITRKKIIVGHHAPIFYSSKIHNFYMKYIARYIMNYFDYHQTLNRQDKEFLEREWNINNVHFIPSGIRTETFLRVKKKRHDGLVFVSVGRYCKQKGFDLALDAIVKFNHSYKNNKVLFLFVGGGEDKALIQSYSRKHKNIIDLGYIEYEQMPKIYSKSDIYLLPSREEPFGLVLIEAWSSGIPVLATMTEGPKDMLRPNKNGWFIKEINVDSIYKSITDLYQKYLKDKNYFTQFTKNCQSTGKRYDITTSAERMSRTFLR